jgi:hypothetical protein
MMRGAMLVTILSLGCAGARPRPPEAARRVPDAIPEKVAAERNSDPHMHSEEEERRWGMEEKRQRDLEQRRRAREKAQQRQGTAGAADVTKQANPSSNGPANPPKDAPANPPANPSPKP